MAQSKPTAVHFFLVAFVVIGIAGWVSWYIEHKFNVERLAQWEEAKKKSIDDDATAKRALEQVEVTKALLGHGLEKLGDPEADKGNPNTVVGASIKDLADYGGDVADKTYTATIKKLAEARRTAVEERDTVKAELATLQANYAALEAKGQAQVAEQKTARDGSEATVVDLTKKKEEELASKQTDIEAQKKAINDLQVELEQEKEAGQKKVKELEQRITNINILNRVLTDELNKVKQVSFEIPDGLIRWVDNVNRLVWINLGEMDNLHKRTTFSVYTRSNSGVARGPEDIKGAIEVTKILGPHQAEARILKDDIFNPMAPGDPVYTPLWSPGRSEEFAFVGIIDANGDKISDRDLLHEIIATAGAKISAEVDDEGKRTGEKIGEKTKFLVLGRIPELEDTGDDEEKKIITKIYDNLKDMRQEAQEHGVRIISLSDFLNYIGYTTQRRLYLPGQDSPYTLTEGARSANVDETAGNRKSSGNTAGIYSTRKKAIKAAPSNTRTTGKLFRQGSVGGN